MANKLTDKQKEALNSIHTAVKSFGFRMFPTKSNKGINVKAILSPSQVSDIEQILETYQTELVSWSVIPGQAGFHPKTGKALAQNTYVGYATDTSVQSSDDLYDLDLS